MDRERLFTALKHGDQDHQDWLQEAINAHFDGKPVPVPRGSGNKEKRIAELEAQIAAWNTRSPEAVTDETGTVTEEMLVAARRAHRDYVGLEPDEPMANRRDLYRAIYEAMHRVSKVSPLIVPQVRGDLAAPTVATREPSLKKSRPSGRVSTIAGESH